jgi:hypothetical protein
MSFEEFAAVYGPWLDRWMQIHSELHLEFPCLDGNCGYRNPVCSNCEHVVKIAHQRVTEQLGAPPDPKDYGR